MSYTKTYKTKVERKKHVDEAEANGYTMTHDDFTKTGGLLTFDLPETPTAEALADKAEVQAIRAYIDGLPEGGAKVLFGRLRDTGRIT